jgi:hypothetical protein
VCGVWTVCMCVWVCLVCVCVGVCGCGWVSVREWLSGPGHCRCHQSCAKVEEAKGLACVSSMVSVPGAGVDSGAVPGACIASGGVPGAGVASVFVFVGSKVCLCRVYMIGGETNLCVGSKVCLCRVYMIGGETNLCEGHRLDQNLFVDKHCGASTHKWPIMCKWQVSARQLHVSAVHR